MKKGQRTTIAISAGISMLLIVFIDSVIIRLTFPDIFTRLVHYVLMPVVLIFCDIIFTKIYRNCMNDIEIFFAVLVHAFVYLASMYAVHYLSGFTPFTGVKLTSLIIYALLFYGFKIFIQLVLAAITPSSDDYSKVTYNDNVTALPRAKGSTDAKGIYISKTAQRTRMLHETSVFNAEGHHQGSSRSLQERTFVKSNFLSPKIVELLVLAALWLLLIYYSVYFVKNFSPSKWVITGTKYSVILGIVLWTLWFLVSLWMNTGPFPRIKEFNSGPIRSAMYVPLFLGAWYGVLFIGIYYPFSVGLPSLVHKILSEKCIIELTIKTKSNSKLCRNGITFEEYGDSFNVSFCYINPATWNHIYPGQRIKIMAKRSFFGISRSQP